MHNAFMSDMSDRLVEARKLAGYATRKDATDALSLHYPTYSGHENGNRDFEPEAVRYAKMYRVNLIWLMTGHGSPRPKGSEHPVVELFESIPAEKRSMAIEYLEFLGRSKG